MRTQLVVLVLCSIGLAGTCNGEVSCTLRVNFGDTGVIFDGAFDATLRIS
jgi:hypothetical protein